LIDYKRDKLFKYGIVKALEIIGEASYMISKELKEKHPEISWNVIIKLRHVLVHGYYQIKDEIVWEIISTDLTLLKEKIEMILQK
jgi:uncharacterized protein with HEPN domain